jgi:hypothetical protein
MKFLFLLFAILSLSANENWILITPLEKNAKTATQLDVNLSQIEPINNIIKNAKVVKQLLDATAKKDLPATNEKDWFIINTKER